MRLHSSLAAMVLVCAGIGAQAQVAAPSCADLHVLPAPRECTAVTSILLGEFSGITVSSEKNAEDEFAAKDLEVSLNRQAAGTPIRGTVIIVRLESASTAAAKELLAHSQLKLDPAMHDEGYVIVPDGKRGLAVVADTSTGLFYGAQTVKQLLRGNGKDAVLLLPTLRDWPAMAHRALSDDWSRGPIPNTEFLKREIRTLAAYKVNIFSPYFEHTFAYASTPVATFPGGAMTPEEGRELVEYAGKYHIMVIPEQESFGHLHHVLKFEQYSHLAETPHGAVLAPGDAGSLPQIKEWFGELDKVFPAPYSHIGADETFELGLGRTRDQVTQRGLGAVYLEFLSKIHQTLAPYNKRLLFWGDVAVNSPELVGTLPKDMIAVPWRYDAEPDFTPLVVPFTKAGLETWVAPGVNNWNRVYPNNNEALGNIRAFVRDGQKLGATGEINTVWNDDGEAIFDENWFGVVFGAAAGWQQGESSEDNFIASFAQSFHDDQTGKISQAHRSLMAAHNVLKKAGLEDGQDTLFWVDPLSPGGREVSAKLLPVASELRLDAEQAITLLAQARAAGKLDNQEALDAMELGARRLDFIGYKFQLAAASIEDYKQAVSLAADASRHEEVSVLLENIQSNNGRFEDMRDGYALLGQLFEKAWLRDNRPYWLANNVALYENATQMWVERSNRFRAVVWNQWWSNHTLPPASETGLPALGN